MANLHVVLCARGAHEHKLHQLHVLHVKLLVGLDKKLERVSSGIWRVRHSEVDGDVFVNNNGFLARRSAQRRELARFLNVAHVFQKLEPGNQAG